MTFVTRSALLLVGLSAVALIAAGCGDDDQSDASATRSIATAMNSEGIGSAAGTEIVVQNSEFGQIVMDSKKQAIYIFENDSEGKSECYGECAEAWPPVPASGEPVAGKGVNEALLGTAKRRDGELQVTYGGKPLYYYAHEDPGEVLCHNVDLNGGLWWVIGSNGERRP